MKLWILRPNEKLTNNKNSPWEPWYDKAFGFIIRAETEDRAREIANDHGGDEIGDPHYLPDRHGIDPWLDKTLSTCVELKSNGIEEMILRDFASA